MGKGVEEEQRMQATVVSEGSERNAGSRCGRVWRLVGVRCVLVVALSAAVFLSAVFWLPPFFQFEGQGDLDLDSQYRVHDIVASFDVWKPVSLLEENILRLEDDIFSEIGFPTTKVVVLSLSPLAGTNITKVVFGVDPDPKNSKISSTAQSLIRASFISLVIRQSSLELTKPLFGDSFYFEVLKFPGGITVIPPQSAFLLQKVQILFNFTLNFSIYQIQINFHELTSQLKSGLHLAPYENLYISLSNSKGSTVVSPTTVQSSVLLTIGNTPSMPRLKQLAQTITDSHSGNLGLNNSVFGKVKQVRLSSSLQHSLHGGDGTVSSSSPSPAPLPHSPHHRHHHHHHPHHHHSAHVAPEISPAPAIESSTPATQKGVPAPGDGSPAPEKSSPAPEISRRAKPPGCQLGYRRSSKRRGGKQSHVAPAVPPSISPHYSALSPRLHVDPPTPVSRPVPASSPLPNVIFAHVKPPSKSESDAEHSESIPSVSPSPSPSSAGLLCPAVQWTCTLFLAGVLHV